MPLPLIAGIGVAAVGTVGTLIAMRRMRKDRKRYEAHRSRYESDYGTYKGLVDEANAEIDDLHLLRIDALDTLHDAADFLVRANVKDRTWDLDAGITPEQFEELQDVLDSLRNLAASATGSVAGGAAAGVAAAGSAYAAAAAFGTASTGAAISGLSGIAARNATLAWLGGGSLASGGSGIAAGAATLANIALAPLALVPLIVLAVKAKNQSMRVDEAIAEMDISVAEMDKHSAELSGVQSRAREVYKAISNVEQTLKDILRLASPDTLEDSYRVFSAAKALAELLELDSDNEPDTPPTGVLANI